MSTDEVAQRAESEKIKLIHKRVREIRASEKMGGKYMQKWEEIELARQEGKEEGQEQGIEQGKMVGLIQGIKIFIRDKLLDQIAEDKIVSKLQQYFSLSEDEAEEYVKRIQQDIQKEISFLRSYDFMKLGQAINHKNWQVAAMTVQRMQKTAQELELDAFVRQLTNIRQCVLHKQARQAKDILAVMMAKRAQMLNQRTEQ